MNLLEQIISLLFSFLYGIIIYKLYNKFYKYLYCNKKMYSFLNSLLFLLNITLIYYIILRKINGGIINIKFILVTIFTFSILSYNK